MLFSISATMLPTQSDIRNAQAIETSHQFDAIEGRLDAINQKIAKQRKYAQALKAHQNNTNNGQNAGNNVWDWTRSYEEWSKWDDLEDLRSEKKWEENRLQSLIEKQEVMQHHHDHSKEKEFFDQPDDIKIKQCDNHRILGNFLFEEGAFSRAAEKYEIAIAYYEYCFPTDPLIQQELDVTRYNCLCNVALCYIRLGWYRKAIESANHVLRECKGEHAKALYRRAQAFRYLDEYENSFSDLQAALILTPKDPAILEELATVQNLKNQYKEAQTTFAQAMLTENNAAEPTTKSSPNIHNPNPHARKSYSMFNTAIPIEPIFPKEFYRIHDRINGITTSTEKENISSL